jgi:two-component system, LytTR family, response regulator LytT
VSAELTVLAVDDERPALDDVCRLLRTLPDVGDVAGVPSGAEALRALSERRFDAVFLDVRMPQLDGLELARVLKRFESPPAVVFVSAYETGAVDAFELQAVDYLMKPVSRERLLQAIQRVRNGRAPPRSSAPAGGDEVVPVATTGGRTRLVARASILYLEAQGDYVRLVADEGRFLVRGRISELEEKWQPFGFVRVHRGYVANMRRAVEVRPRVNGTAALVLANGDEIPIARRKTGALRQALGG